MIEAEYKARTSLLAFRKKFIPSKDDVPPAKFHEEWSNILLNGTGNFAAAMLEAQKDIDYLSFSRNRDKNALRRLLKRFPHWRCSEGSV